MHDHHEHDENCDHDHNHDEEPTELELALEGIYVALEDEDMDAARVALAAAEKVAPEDPDVFYARAQIYWLEGGAQAALKDLSRAVEVAPDHSDAHYALGQVYEELEDEAAMIRHNLEVHRLDSDMDEELEALPKEYQEFVAVAAERALESVPDEIRARLVNVPVVLVTRPSLALVKDGFDPRAFGLFEGADDLAHHDSSVVTSPSKIVIFYGNLLAAFDDQDELEEQVAITVFHEVGHFFGLDEEQVAALGLE